MPKYEFFTLNEFLQSEARSKFDLWCVTWREKLVGIDKLHEDQHCEILYWENSNCKWYRPEPLEGRVEIGHCFTIALPNNCIGKVTHIRFA